MVILLVAAWAVAGTWLWRTSVPASFDAGGLDVHRYFSPAQLAESRRFAPFLQINWALSTLASIAARTAWRAWKFAWMSEMTATRMGHWP